MLKLMDLLTEGVYDKGIFKAVFMAGGPGSGKTYVSSKLFGIPEKASVSVGGLSVVNSDRQFMYLLKKFGFDPTKLARYPDQWFDEIQKSMEKGGSKTESANGMMMDGGSNSGSSSNNNMHGKKKGKHRR